MQGWPRTAARDRDTGAGAALLTRLLPLEMSIIPDLLKSEISGIMQLNVKPTVFQNINYNYLEKRIPAEGER